MVDVIGAVCVVFECLLMILRIVYEIIRSFVLILIPPNLKDVKDEIVLITGSGHGIGREMAFRFARLGAVIVCVDVNSSTNAETAKIIKQDKGRAHSYQCDVSNRAAVLDLAEKVRREVGDVGILVNNAGIMPCNPVLTQTEQEIRLMNDINISGNIWMIQAFLPAMMTRNHGHIVAMSSMAGMIGLTNLVPYCGSKYAVRGLMEALALELHQSPNDLSGIKLTTIYPFIVDTGLCHKPRIRFPLLMKVVTPGDAADTIVKAVRRNYTEVSVPQDLYYLVRYIYQLIPQRATFVVSDFLNSGVDAHDR